MSITINGDVSKSQIGGEGNTMTNYGDINVHKTAENLAEKLQALIAELPEGTEVRNEIESALTEVEAISNEPSVEKKASLFDKLINAGKLFGALDKIHDVSEEHAPKVLALATGAQALLPPLMS